MNIKSVLLAAALTATVMMSSSFAQGCADCPSSAGQCSTGGCNSCSSDGNPGFGYPAGCCATCGKAGGCGHLKEKLGYAIEAHHKVMARNRAWPKPFNCADRQLYFSIWEPFLDAGYEKHCTLTQAHFDSETQELNKYGQSAVAGIMQNMPSHRKTIFIHRDVDQTISDIRMNEVRSSIQTWYGASTTASIAFTDNLPTRINGDRIEIINNLYREGTPDPIIPVAKGGASLGGGS